MTRITALFSCFHLQDQSQSKHASCKLIFLGRSLHTQLSISGISRTFPTTYSWRKFFWIDPLHDRICKIKRATMYLWVARVLSVKAKSYWCCGPPLPYGNFTKPHFHSRKAGPSKQSTRFVKTENLFEMLWQFPFGIIDIILHLIFCIDIKSTFVSEGCQENSGETRVR